MKHTHAFSLAAAALALQAAPPVTAQLPVECTTVPGNAAEPFFAGPVNPQNGFAEYVTDSNGLSLEICLDSVTGDGNPPFCFFDPLDPANPFSVQVGFGPEAFWWLAGAVVATAAGGRAEVVLGAEAAWAAEVPNAGDQFPFIRLRIRVDVPADGDYTVTHPYGTSVFTGVTAAGGINDTIDIPFLPGTLAADGTVTEQQNRGPAGPWLTWDTFDPDPQLTDPALLGPAGEQYVGDGVTDHLVVGSPCGTNFLEVVGPVGTALDPVDGDNIVRTDLFSVQGKLFDGRLATQMAVDRTSYQRDAASNGQADAFTTGAPDAAVVLRGDPNLPAGDLPLTSDPADARVAGKFFASELLTPDAASVPPVVELEASDPAAVTDPTRLVQPLTDVVTITRAEYNTQTLTLTVEGVSSDALVVPELTLVGSGEPLPARLVTLAPPARVTVSSSAGGSDTEPVTVVANLPPLAVDDTAITDEDVALEIDVLANDSDPDGTIDPTTLAIVTGPANGAALVVAGPLTTVVYTPAADFNGQDSFTYTVEDDAGNLSNAANVTVTVNPVNDAPVAVDDAATTDQDTAVAIDVLANDSDVDGDALTVSVLSGAANGTLVNNGGNVTYTPNAGFFGTDSFTYTASDGALDSNTATVTVTVNRVNTAPLAVDDAAITDEDTPVTIDVLANDSDPDGDAVAIAFVNALGTNGTLVINADDTVTYTPNADFFGSDGFTYTVTDGNGGTATATVTLTVNPVNDVPVAVDDAAATDQEVPVAIDVLANDSDVDGDALSVSAVSDGADGTVTTDGAIVSYTPNAGFSGTDTFTYTASDGNGGTATATVAVTVNAVAVDLDIAQLQVTRNVRLNRDPTVAISLRVRNNGQVDSPRPATVVGVQNGSVVYSETLLVSDPLAGGQTAFDFPAYTATATGDITWTATIDDTDPDLDEEVAATRVR